MDLSCRVCTIGGGSGMPVVNKGLLKAGCRDIASIVTTFDSGGHTGRMRTDERGHVLAFSDYWRALMSLWTDGTHKSAWEEMLLFRDGRGRNFGNVFFQFMSEKAGSLTAVQSLFQDLTGAKLHGRVIPVSLEPSDIGFCTASGRRYHGEHHLDELRMSLDRVTQIWLEPEVPANTEAVRALAEADLVVICPGSLFGSILVNFMPGGMVDAFLRSKAPKILLTNIMSVANETCECTQDEYVGVFAGCLQEPHPFDLVVMPDLGALDSDLLAPVLESYRLEHSVPLHYHPASPHATILADLALVEPRYGRLRHCENKLAEFFRALSL